MPHLSSKSTSRRPHILTRASSFDPFSTAIQTLQMEFGSAFDSRDTFDDSGRPSGATLILFANLSFRPSTRPLRIPDV